jgi:hypothetical protein
MNLKFLRLPIYCIVTHLILILGIPAYSGLNSRICSDRFCTERLARLSLFFAARRTRSLFIFLFTCSTNPRYQEVRSPRILSCRATRCISLRCISASPSWAEDWRGQNPLLQSPQRMSWQSKSGWSFVTMPADCESDFLCSFDVCG